MSELTAPGMSSSQLASSIASTPARRHFRVASVSAEVVHALARFAEAGANWRSLKLDPAIRGELRGVWNNYLAHLLGHQPKMHDYLGFLAR